MSGIKVSCPICGAEISMNVYNTRYHNGNGTVLTLSVEPIDGCDCEWTDKQSEELEEKAIEIYHIDEPAQSYSERFTPDDEENNKDYLYAEVSALRSQL